MPSKEKVTNPHGMMLRYNDDQKHRLVKNWEVFRRIFPKNT